MEINKQVIEPQQKMIFNLESLFHQYGYQPYKMNKFEEYDLYSQNKDFLISDNIITFNDTNGKLLALKPDVTLSIVRNCRNITGLQKVYYNENIYRVSKYTKSFKEIRQVGVEALGQVDDYVISETLLLALKSLQRISENYKLTITHLEILNQLVERLNTDKQAQAEIIRCIDSKNIHEIEQYSRDSKQLQLLKKLLSSSLTLDELFELLEENDFDEASVKQFKGLLSLLQQSGYSERIAVDFSIVSNLNYYNGIAFKGYIQGIETRVLAGGQYDKLMKKMNRKSKAIGFAIYMDLLERIFESNSSDVVDIVVVYKEDVDLIQLNSLVEKLIEEGNAVYTTKVLNNNMKYTALIEFREENE